MAKMYGFSGRLTGRKGDAVFAVRGGDQIVRQYNPVVANPKTPAQTENRQKLKLLSQLGAVFAPYMAIKSEGAKSGRNIFSSKLYDKVEFEALSNEAKINMIDIVLTNSNRPFPGVVIGVDDMDLNVSATLPLDASVTKVAYVLCTIDAGGEIRFIGDAVESTPGATRQFTHTFENGALTVVGQRVYAYAYGIIENEGADSVRLNELVGDSVQQAAKLLSTRSSYAGNSVVTRSVATEEQISV